MTDSLAVASTSTYNAMMKDPLDDGSFIECPVLSPDEEDDGLTPLLLTPIAAGGGLYRGELSDYETCVIDYHHHHGGDIVVKH